MKRENIDLLSANLVSAKNSFEHLAKKGTLSIEQFVAFEELAQEAEEFENTFKEYCENELL